MFCCLFCLTYLCMCCCVVCVWVGGRVCVLVAYKCAWLVFCCSMSDLLFVCVCFVVMRILSCMCVGCHNGMIPAHMSSDCRSIFSREGQGVWSRRPARFTIEQVTGLSLVFWCRIILDEHLKLSARCQVYGPPFPRPLASSPPASSACVVCKIIRRAQGHFQKARPYGAACWIC